MDTDTQVLQDVIAEFKASPVLLYAKLNVAIQDGVVTISAGVNSFAQRKAIERAANHVARIKTLILEVRAAAIPHVVVDTVGRRDPQ